MPLIPEQTLDDIQSRVDIAEVIGRYVLLKRAGRQFKALCPFHKERTPSFHINTDKQIFHCFGCGVGGNVFSFLMQQERLTFPEAVRQVAEQVGLELPAASSASRNGQAPRLLEILEKAARYYERMLLSPSLGKPARDYLRSRGVSDHARQVFRLGYAPGGGARLMEAAKRSRISLELLEQAGLTVRGTRSLADRFRQRLLFPIQDLRGRVIGFGGRSLGGQEPKYLNSPETAVYTKGRQLFGLAQAKDAIVKAKTAIVVEGYFDCVWLWQAGIQRVVSPLGTAFTPEQAKLLSRFTDRVVLAFDADAAGEAAALRGIDVLVEAGLNVYVAQLPAGTDPDEFVRAYGTHAFEELAEGALSVLEFLGACAQRRHPGQDPEGKVRAAQFMLPTIAKVPNAMLRAEYVRVLAARLRIDEGAVLAELGKVSSRTHPAAVAAPVRRTTMQHAERLFVALVLDDPSRWEPARGGLTPDQLTDERLRRILAAIAEIRSAGTASVTPAQVISRLGGADLSSVVSELVHVAQAEPAKGEAFRKCVQRLRQDLRQRQRDQLRAQLQVAQQLGQEDEVTRLLRQLQAVMHDMVPASQEASESGGVKG
mgnify:CR=1 FL=1